MKKGLGYFLLVIAFILALSTITYFALPLIKKGVAKNVVASPGVVVKALASVPAKIGIVAAKVSKAKAAEQKTLQVPILMYHHVGDLPPNPNATRKDLTVPTQNFNQEVQWVASQGYTTVSLEDLYLYSQGKFQMPQKAIIFTFDDGYKDVFQNALPILKQYNFSGSFGIITQWPGQTQGDNIYASWDDVTAAQNQGMEIVCHTQNHFDGTDPKFNSDYIFQNLSGCKQDLADHGISTDILIYPYGHYTADYMVQAKKAGFVMALTVHEGDQIDLENLMQEPRVRVHGAETLQRFEDILLHKVEPSSTPTTIENLLKKAS